MKNNSYTVAVMGAGNIGSEVIERLLHLDDELINVSLSKVLVLDISKKRDIDSNLLTADFTDILNDEDIDLYPPRGPRRPKTPMIVIMGR